MSPLSQLIYKTLPTSQLLHLYFCGMHEDDDNKLIRNYSWPYANAPSPKFDVLSVEYSIDDHLCRRGFFRRVRGAAQSTEFLNSTVSHTVNLHTL
jgi:hypothetical protein